jgi:cytosine/adenosine deaminase-related metal-dependent hydrolase
MPALINPHTHLEFSRNKTALHYGAFIGWLQSVIEKRENLLSDDGLETVIEGLLAQMLKYGVASIGAISSFGKDFMPCVGAKQKIVYFNEILGTQPARFESTWHDFIARLNRAERFASHKFRPAISVHSTYSIHPTLLEQALDLAKKDALLTSTHYLESRAERNWLVRSTGEFKVFFKQNFGVEKSFQNQFDFVSKFDGVDTLFVHCVYANDEELEAIKNVNGHIVHCPVSNRLLGGKYFDVERAKNLDIAYSIGTDGLSSNFSLNPMREIRHALFGYLDLNLHLLGYDLLKAVTKNAASALKLNSGALKNGLDADIITFCLPGKVENEEDLALQIILHTDEVDSIYIDGEHS